MSYNVEGRWLYEVNKRARESIKDLTYDELAQKYIELLTEMCIHERETKYHFQRVEDIIAHTCDQREE